MKVWFTANGGTNNFAKSQAFTYTLASDTGAPVLILSQENYSGPVPAYADPTKPAYLDTYSSHSTPSASSTTSGTSTPAASPRPTRSA